MPTRAQASLFINLRTNIARLNRTLVHRRPASSHTSSSTTVEPQNQNKSTDQHANPSSSAQPDQPKPKEKTIAELDEELRLKMAGLVGDGGEAGVEYEDGQPVAMKRSVKANMFRYI